METAAEEEMAILEAFEFKTSDMKYEEKSKDDDKAVVTVSGKISLEINADKLKEAVKEQAEAAGEEVSDEDLDFFVDMFTSGMGDEVEFEEDLDVIKEDGKWVVCDELEVLDEVAPDF
jgi:hypothetical protein